MSDLWFKNSTIAMLYAIAFLIIFFGFYLYIFDYFIDLLKDKRVESLYGYIFGFTTFIYVVGIALSNILNKFIQKNLFISIVIAFLTLSFVFILLKFDYIVTYLFVVSDSVKLLMMILVAFIPIYAIYSIAWEYFYNIKDVRIDLMVVTLVSVVEMALLKNWLTPLGV